MSAVRVRLSSERGAASLIMVGVIAVVLMIGAALVVGAAAAAQQTAAQHAADEAALAGARTARDQVAMGRPAAQAACAAAVSAASDHRASVTRCVTVGAVVTVDTAMGAGLTRASAQAVAGPALARGGGSATRPG